MFKIITIPFNRSQKGFNEEVLSKFILNNQVKFHRAEFFQDGEDAHWTVFLEYDPLVEKASEREIDGLDEPQRMLLERLKAWRKEKGEKDGVPVYIVCTNRELADIAVQAPRTLEALKAVKGFGKGKMG
jgi:superfamily II DNA helicase RecQ